jgi:DNA-binding PadR family transcriptional regulator
MRNEEARRHGDHDDRRRRNDDEGWRTRGDEEGWRSRRGSRRGHVRGGGFAERAAPPGSPRFHGGPGPWPGEMRMRGPRARRGDVRAAALALLAEGPMNGYQIIQEIGERSDGVWRPSPGSVYPALQQLEDEGLIRAGADDSGRRAYQLTDEGRSYVAAHPDEVRAPWDDVVGATGGAAIDMRNLLRQVGMAGYQVLSAGTDAQVRQARKILTDTRRSLYRILAADEDEADGAQPGGGTRADGTGSGGAEPGTAAGADRG